MMSEAEAREENTSRLDRIMRLVNALPTQEQERLLNQLQRMTSATPPGTPGKDLLFIAGCIPKDDLEIMRKAADEDCEQIDYEAW